MGTRAVAVFGLVNLVAAGSPVMRTVGAGIGSTGTDTGTGGLRSSNANNYIMWNKYSAGTSSCNLHNSGQKLDIQRIPHGCSGVSVSSWGSFDGWLWCPSFSLFSSSPQSGSLAYCGYRYCG